MDAKLIQCLLCEHHTLEESLMAHINYNHMIYKKAIREVMYKLHYPPIRKGCCNAMITLCEKEAKDKSRKPNISPFLVSPGKRKIFTEHPNKKKIKIELVTPQNNKKAIVLKKPTPARKHLAPMTSYEMMEDTPSASDTQVTPTKIRLNSKNFDYDDVYTKKENSDKPNSSVQKIRELQQNELYCNMDDGTYVQCCECNKWRLVREYEDPSMVPEYWVCSMSKDPEANTCDKGTGDNVSSDEDYVSVEFACGSMVWVKFSGYPWWPGMVDYCPEEEETYLVGDDPKVASKYHVVFFDKTKNVARAWVSKEFLVKLVKTEDPPKPLGPFKYDSIKKRYNIAKSMADDAVNLHRIERIEKYSFASLYTGKWREASDDSEDQDRRFTEIDIDPRLIGISDFHSSPGVEKRVATKKIKKRLNKEKRLKTVAKSLNENSVKEEFKCLKCQNSIKLCRNFVKNHLRKHKMTFTDYWLKFDQPDNEENLHWIKEWLKNEDYLSQISEAALKRRQSCDDNLSEISQSVDGENVPPFLESVTPPPVTNEELQSCLDKNGTSECLSSKNGVNFLNSLIHDADIVPKTESRESPELNLDVKDQLCNSPEMTQEDNGELEQEAQHTTLRCLNDEEEIFEEICDTNENNLRDEEGEKNKNCINPKPGENIVNDDLDNLKNQLESFKKQRKKEIVPKNPRKSSKNENDENKRSSTILSSEPSSPEVDSGGLEQKHFIKPPMSPELLIAIAVRNLDPYTDIGASCTDIVAFLSLHFPYYNTRNDECKDMVRRECGMSSSFESGRENFQMKAEINCVDRIHAYVQNNREKISDSMLEPEFLDTIIDRFVKKDSMVESSSRQIPPFSRDMLTHISLMKLSPQATLEQIIILLKFLFPALAKSGVMEAFRKEFLEKIAKSAELSAKVEKNNITFVLKDKYREQVLEDLRNFSLENLEAIGESLLSDKFFDIILPIF